MSKESFRSSCDLYVSRLYTRGFTLCNGVPGLEPFSYCSSRAMNVWMTISIKSFTIDNFVEINPKRA
jgi:hypothetical protein